MTRAVILEQALAAALRERKTDTLDYIHRQFLKSKKRTYVRFLADFLKMYGIKSFDVLPDAAMNEGKYYPYIECDEANIFGDPNGVIKLISESISAASSEKILADYILENIQRLDISVLRAWHAN